MTDQSHVALVLAFCGLWATACQPQNPAAESQAQQVSSAASIVGTWYDESRILLKMRDGEEVIKVLDRRTTAKQFIAEYEGDSESIQDWMVLDFRRTFTQSKYTLDAACGTSNGDRTSLSAESPIKLDEDARSFSVNGEEQIRSKKIGSFVCQASIPSKPKRKYRIEQDAQGSVLLLDSGDGEIRSFRDKESGTPDSAASTSATVAVRATETCRNKETVRFSKGWNTDYVLAFDQTKGANGWTVSVTAKATNSEKTEDWGTHQVELAIDKGSNAKFQTFAENDDRILIHRPEGRETLRIVMNCQKQ